VQIQSHSWADSVYQHAKGTPLVFVDNYTYPSLYQYFYPDQLATCYSTIYYRKNNYGLQNWSVFNNKTVYVVRQIKMADGDFEVYTNYVPTFLHKVDSFKAINGLKISWLNKINVGKAGQKISATIELSNPMNYSINGNNLFLNYTFIKSKNDVMVSENIPVEEKELPQSFKKTQEIEMTWPNTPGKYKLVFSFDQYFLGPTFASPLYTVEIK
jgi:hypothetical protein